eukprot:TRINITY_DN327_c0_g1_i1.p1 TRINITY_DN327_c0_g1~~TRINITY_DN327_c0_g1_i1.p1  ORF type:complete len:241 (+),score=21.47 TRINITY_DN327_c0_g1_i1:84-806(+)
MPVATTSQICNAVSFLETNFPQDRPLKQLCLKSLKKLSKKALAFHKTPCPHSDCPYQHFPQPVIETLRGVLSIDRNSHGKKPSACILWLLTGTCKFEGKCKYSHISLLQWPMALPPVEGDQGQEEPACPSLLKKKKECLVDDDSSSAGKCSDSDGISLESNTTDEVDSLEEGVPAEVLRCIESWDGCTELEVPCERAEFLEWYNVTLVPLLLGATNGWGFLAHVEDVCAEVGLPVGGDVP